MRRSAWLQGAGFVLLSGLAAGTAWAVPYLPTNDGPEWLFGAHIENHYGDPGSLYPELLVPAPQFASRGFTFIGGPLEAWLGWQHGQQAALAVMALLGGFAFALLVRAMDRERWALGFLGFPLALSWSFYMGLWAFTVSTAIGVGCVALAVALREPGWRGRALLSAALLVNAVAHVFGAVLSGGAILALSLARAPRGKRLAELGWVLLTGLPAAGVLVASAVASRNLARGDLSGGFERFAWGDTLRMLPTTIAPGPLGRAVVVTACVTLALGVALARSFRRATSPADRGLGVAGALLLATGVLAPFQIPGWQAFPERFFPLGVGLVLAVLPLDRAPAWIRRWAPVALFALSAACLGLSYPLHRRLAALCPDALAGLSADVPMRGEILPVWLRGTELPVHDRIRAEVPLMAPLVHMATAYTVAHGGVSAYTFSSSPALNLFQKRPRQAAPPVPAFEHYMRALASDAFHHDLAYRREVEGELASAGMFYDGVAVFGALPEDLSVWRERGYVTDWVQGTALVAHFEPCSVDVVTSAPPAGAAPEFDLRVGKIGLMTGVRVPAEVRADGSTHFVIDTAPCGAVAVRAREQGRAPQGGSFCRNADADGYLLAHITRAHRRISCQLE
jgi:hypothetical protein